MYTVCVVLLVATTYGGLGVNPVGAEPLPVGPVVSNNEWTPVVNSRRVYIDPQVLAKYRQQDKDEQEAAQDRYDVVDNGNNRVEYTDTVNSQKPEVSPVLVEDTTEEVIFIQEEQQFEPQRVRPQETQQPPNQPPVQAQSQPQAQPTNQQQEEKEEQPIIVYPEGTLSQQNNYEDRPAPVYPSANQPQQPQYPPRPPPNRPPPPPLNRRPRPPPPNVRRPAPPSKYLPALSRNPNPPYPQEDGRVPPPPPQRPPPRGPPPRRPPPRRPPQQGVLSSIGQGLSNIAGGVRCKATEVGADIKLQDDNFVRSQLDCVLDEGPCDELGSTLKRLAPDVMQGRFPPPCNECKKKQIQRVMSTIALKYPKEWNQMVQRVG